MYEQPSKLVTCRLIITSGHHVSKTEAILDTALENMSVSATICWKTSFFPENFLNTAIFLFIQECSSNGLQLTWPETKIIWYKDDMKQYHNSFLFWQKTKQTENLTPKQNPKNFFCINTFYAFSKRLLPMTLKCLFFHWYQGISLASKDLLW